MLHQSTGDWQNCRTVQGPTIEELASQRVVLLTFLRHNGCTFCREALGDISKVRARVLGEGGDFVVVHHGDDRRFARLLAQVGLDDMPRIHDPGRELYRAFGLSEARLEQWLAPRIMLRGIEALWAGHGIGLPDGSIFQMPGLFAISGGEIVTSHYHNSIEERPDYLSILREALAQAPAGVAGAGGASITPALA